MLLDAAGAIANMRVYAALLNYEALRAGAPPAAVVDTLRELAERCDCRMVTGFPAEHAGEIFLFLAFSFVAQNVVVARRSLWAGVRPARRPAAAGRAG
jgi:hypothetical protein